MGRKKPELAKVQMSREKLELRMRSKAKRIPILVLYIYIYIYIRKRIPLRVTMYIHTVDRVANTRRVREQIQESVKQLHHLHIWRKRRS